MQICCSGVATSASRWRGREMQWLGVGSFHAQRVDASVPLQPARVDHVVLVWPRRRYVARLPGCLAARPLEELAVFEFAKRPFEAVLTSKAAKPAAPRRQRCGFPTMLAADFAPVPALAVGLETNVGRRKGKRRARRVAAEAFVGWTS